MKHPKNKQQEKHNFDCITAPITTYTPFSWARLYLDQWYPSWF